MTGEPTRGISRSMRRTPGQPPLAQSILSHIEADGWRSVRAWALHHGINYDTVRSILRGKSQHGRADTIERIAQAFRMTADALRGEVTGALREDQAPGFHIPVNDLDADDEAFGEAARMVATALTANHLPADPGTVASTAARVWRNATVLPDSMPLVDRIQLSIDEAISVALQRRREALGKP